MEIHRLTPMKEGYSRELFERLYKETRPLRRSLVNGIDPRYYGVTKDIIESWFDDKFIYVFNKHCMDEDKSPDVLKGFIISSLQMFKNRVLRQAYSHKAEFYTSTIELEGETRMINYIPDKEDTTESEIFFGMVLEFFKKELSDNAFTLLQLQLNPPPYILSRINKSNSQIPLELILEYFELDYIHKNVKLIRNLKKELALATEKARQVLNPNLALPI